MNERIRELAIEAGYDMDMQQHNKFAELIVRECAGLVQGISIDSMGYHTADQKIKEHFGVEE